MSLVRPQFGFVPPVVAVPAANTIVPFIPPAIGAAAGVAGLVGGAPPLVVLGGAVLVGALLGAAIEQLWGWANGRKGTQATGTDPVPTGLPSDAEGGTLFSPPAGQYLRVYDPAGFGRSSTYAAPVSFWWAEFNQSGSAFLWLALDGFPPFRWRETLFYGFEVATGAPPISFVLTYVEPDGTPLPAPVVPAEPQPAWDPFPQEVPVLPEPEPLPEPDPLPERPKVVPPFVAPAIPGSRPTDPAPAGVPTPTTPRTSPPPAVLPRVPGFPAPWSPTVTAPEGTQTRPDGTVTPTPKPPVVKTPTDVHVIDGIPVPGNGPRPTPEGTAQELGRIEKKLAQLIDPKSDGLGFPRDRLGILRDNLFNVIDFLTSINGGGTYEISSPCELDENGDRIVRSVEYPGNFQSLGVISNKIDALAALLQEHKDLKQPICRQTPAVGQPVTVNFVQVD